MSEMIERVARAIWESPTYDEIAERSAGGPRPMAWTDAHPLDQELVRTLARAAIEAMREPTEEMVRAGDETDHTIEAWAEKPDYEGQITNFWRAMIDAALTPPPGTPAVADDKAQSPKLV